MKTNSIQHQYAIKPLHKMNPHNPYKYEDETSDWEKICKKYGEEDKFKPIKKRKRKPKPTK